MRLNRASNSGDRSNALWGRGSRGESRSNALWGRGGRRAGSIVASFAVVCALAASASAAGVGSGSGKSFGNLKSFVAPDLLSSIQQNPKQSFDVIVQGDRKTKSSALLQKLVQDKSGASDENVGAESVKKTFLSIDGGLLTLTGKQILRLAKVGLVDSIQLNGSVGASGVALPASNTQLWPWAVGAPVDWVNGTPKTPTIAIVDSGIDATRSDVAGRVLGQVNLANRPGNTPTGDGYGHGTFVAGIAAGAAPGHAGVAPKANLLSVDIMNDQGQATVADVVAAADWILQNKSTYNIKVANFSLHSVNRASIRFDPIDQAVEKLWLNGVTVVAAAGNYAVDGAESGVQFAPGNDPFVITVGATDIGSSIKPTDDLSAPFSAWGYTPDGFMKPEIGAPGRYMIGPVPQTGVLYSQRPDHVTSPGYMQLSGTSFAAPVVAGAAAMLMGQHPDWTPDQVKGALMLTATPQPRVTLGQLGVGEVNIASARALKLKAVPNPNAALNQFVGTAPDGTRVFDAAAWSDAAWADAAWADAAWSDAAWSSAAWSSAAWSDAAWSDAAWASAAWGTAAWSDAAWSDAAWSDAAWADGAGGDSSIGADPTSIDPAAQASALAALGIVDPSCDPTLTTCVLPGAAVAAPSPGLLP
ncbi:MAG: serine protease AprX [Gaiellaceae bacterium]|jgi:serine protease AprX|nr:serine protease AprX [Gaiellaceae bacterium]MDX6468500.1 serine protease AprX [Gaiellaceae bacterium]MDX6474005.1 serine protease AprX [Gaiellaceae bacterium]